MIENYLKARIKDFASSYSHHAPLLIVGVCLLIFAAGPAMAQPATTTSTLEPASTAPAGVDQPAIHPEGGVENTDTLRTSSTTPPNGTKIGDIYCKTGVEDAIDVGFTALAGLGLPLTAGYLVIVGVRYLKASTEQQKKEAKDSLTNAAIGFAIIVGAIISPELIDKIGTQVGFTFSKCVKPF